MYNKLLSSKFIYWFINKSKAACYDFGYIRRFVGSNIETHCYSYSEWKECDIRDKERFFKKMLNEYKKKIENNVLLQVYRFFKEIF